MHLVWQIEETCLNAFPSLKHVLHGEWLVRFAGGVSRRANSANPRSAQANASPSLIAEIEALYRAQGQPAIFRVPSIADLGIDQMLTASGYSTEGETCVLHAPITRAAAASDTAVQLLAAPTSGWLIAMSTLQARTPAHAAIYERIAESIAVPARFASLVVDGEPAALAYGALHAGLLCYESVITAPDHRRQGLARRVVAALAAWAQDAGADGVCLQVEAANTSAKALYTRFGMEELFRYHYRRQPSRT
jgi:N-acetylglutamate synthase